MTNKLIKEFEINKWLDVYQVKKPRAGLVALILEALEEAEKRGKIKE